MSKFETGTKVLVVETGEIGTVFSVTSDGQPKYVNIGDKIIDVTGKTIKVLTWLIEILLFIKKLIWTK